MLSEVNSPCHWGDKLAWSLIEEAGACHIVQYWQPSTEINETTGNILCVESLT